MAMAAGEDDADKFKSGGVLTCSASVQDSGEDRFTNTCGAYDVNHLKCVHGGVSAAASSLCWMNCVFWTRWKSSVAVTNG